MTYRRARSPSGAGRTLGEEENSEALVKLLPSSPTLGLPEQSYDPGTSAALASMGAEGITEVQECRVPAQAHAIPHPPAALTPQPTHPRTLQALDGDRSREGELGDPR